MNDTIITRCCVNFGGHCHSSDGYILFIGHQSRSARRTLPDARLALFETFVVAYHVRACVYVCVFNVIWALASHIFIRSANNARASGASDKYTRRRHKRARISARTRRGRLMHTHIYRPCGSARLAKGLRTRDVWPVEIILSHNATLIRVQCNATTRRRYATATTVS